MRALIRKQSSVSFVHLLYQLICVCSSLFELLRIKSFGNVSLQDSDSESSEDESGGIVQTHTEGGLGAHHNVPTARTVPTARVIEGENVVFEIELFRF